MKNQLFGFAKICFGFAAVLGVQAAFGESWPIDAQLSASIESGYVTVLWKTAAIHGAVGPSGSNPLRFGIDGPEPGQDVSLAGQFEAYPSAIVHSYTFPKRKPGLYSLKDLQNPSDFAIFGTAVLQWAIIDGGPIARISSEMDVRPRTRQISWSSSNAETVEVKGDGLESSLSAGSQTVRSLKAGIHTYTISATKNQMVATAVTRITISPENDDVRQVPLPVSARLKLASDRISEGVSDLLDVIADGMADNGASVVGTDGTSIKNPPASVALQPKAGSYTYTLTVSGLVRIDLTSIESDELWVDYPSGSSVNASALTHLDVPAGATYRLRMRYGTEWSQFDVVTQPNIATAQASVTVLAAKPANVFTVAVVPQSSSYTVQSGAAAGHSYRRSWGDTGGWHAYLARDGVLIGVNAKNSAEGIAVVQLQAKTPNSDWGDLAPPQAAKDSSLSAAQAGVATSFSVKLGTNRSDKPLVPSDSSMAGTWQLRARAQSTSGKWSDWSDSTPLTVEMPIVSVVKAARTLPPTQDAAWFSASPVKNYAVQVWVP